MIERWRAASSAVKVIVLIVAAAILLNVGSFIIDKVVGPSAEAGPTSSSYTRDSDGLAAYAELLERSGVTVQRSREPLRTATLSPTSTVVLVDAFIEGSEGDALKRFVAAGGHLIAGGGQGASILHAVSVNVRPSSSPSAPSQVIVPVAETAGVGKLAPASGWQSSGTALPVVAGESGVTVAVQNIGRGRLVAISDAAILSNQSLASADNAAFALAATSNRTVIFIESVHGFGEGEGFDAFPTSWKFTAAGLLLATVLWMLASGRRLGPPDPSELEKVPARHEYVEALAATLQRSRDPNHTIDPVRAQVKARLDQAAHYASDLGLTDEELEAVVSPSGDEQSILAAGRALARLESGEVS